MDECQSFWGQLLPFFGFVALRPPLPAYRVDTATSGACSSSPVRVGDDERSFPVRERLRWRNGTLDRRKDLKRRKRGQKLVAPRGRPMAPAFEPAEERG
jgi:hypothetical protein